MSSADNKLMRRRLANAYLSSVISLSLVLLLVGVAAMLLVNARSVSDYFKENMQVTVMMKQDVSDEAAMDFQADLDKERFIRKSLFVSKEQGMRKNTENSRILWKIGGFRAAFRCFFWEGVVAGSP